MNADLDRKFWEYHFANPKVYELLVKRARQAKKTGLETVGFRMLWENVRWEIIEAGQLEFKLNDHLTSRYARLIMAQERDLEGLFPIRGLRSS